MSQALPGSYASLLLYYAAYISGGCQLETLLSIDISGHAAMLASTWTAKVHASAMRQQQCLAASCTAGQSGSRSTAAAWQEGDLRPLLATAGRQTQARRPLRLALCAGYA
jgi:hypothetical protein